MVKAQLQCHTSDLLPVAISVDSGRLSSVRSRFADEIVTGRVTQLGAPLVEDVVVVVVVVEAFRGAAVAVGLDDFFARVTAALMLPNVLVLELLLLLALLLPLTLSTFKLLPKLVLLRLLMFQLPVLSSISSSD